MSVRGRSLVTVLCVIAFGLTAGLVHGNSGGLGAALGNLSTPWLLVALVPSWWSGSAIRGIVTGTIATLVGLAAYYISLTATMYGHLGNVHGITRSFVFVLAANRVWFLAGLASGPLLGLVGGYVGQRASRHALVVIAGALMVGELLVVEAVSGIRLPILNASWASSDLRGYVVQAALGMVLLATLARRRVRSVQ